MDECKECQGYRVINTSCFSQKPCPSCCGRETRTWRCTKSSTHDPNKDGRYTVTSNSGCAKYDMSTSGCAECGASVALVTIVTHEAPTPEPSVSAEPALPTPEQLAASLFPLPGIVPSYAVALEAATRATRADRAAMRAFLEAWADQLASQQGVAIGAGQVSVGPCNVDSPRALREAARLLSPEPAQRGAR